MTTLLLRSSLFLILAFLFTTESSSTLKTQNNDSSAPKSKILFFMHFHKAGGSSICRMAAEAGYKIPLKTNCNAFIEDDKNKKLSCCGKTTQDQQNFAKTTDYTFVANEKHLYQDLDTQYYTYMVVFRDPWDRYSSHYKYARDYFFNVRIMGKFDKWVSSQPDNFMLRSLCGPKCEKVKTGDLNEKHLNFVKKRLDKFSAILILENFDESMEILYNDPIFEGKWETIKQKNAGKAHHGNTFRNHNEVVATKEIKEKYNYLVTFDLELYEYAKFLSRVQIERAKSYKKYSNLDCENSCCAEECSVFK